MGQGREDGLFDLQRAVRGIHQQGFVQGRVAPGPTMPRGDRWLLRMAEARPEGQEQAALRDRDGSRRQHDHGRALVALVQSGREGRNRELHDHDDLVERGDEAAAQPDVGDSRRCGLAGMLGETPVPPDDLLSLLRPCPDEWLKTWPASKDVGNVANNRPDLWEPIPL